MSHNKSSRFHIDRVLQGEAKSGQTVAELWAIEKVRSEYDSLRFKLPKADPKKLLVKSQSTWARWLGLDGAISYLVFGFIAASIAGVFLEVSHVISQNKTFKTTGSIETILQKFQKPEEIKSQSQVAINKSNESAAISNDWQQVRSAQSELVIIREEVHSEDKKNSVSRTAELAVKVETKQSFEYISIWAVSSAGAYPIYSDKNGLALKGPITGGWRMPFGIFSYKQREPQYLVAAVSDSVIAASDMRFFVDQITPYEHGKWTFKRSDIVVEVLKEKLVPF